MKAPKEKGSLIDRLGSYAVRGVVGVGTLGFVGGVIWQFELVMMILLTAVVLTVMGLSSFGKGC